MYEIYFERSIRPSIYQRFKGKHFQDILRFAILNMYAYSALILKVFQSEIQETFKFNVDDIYFWLDSELIKLHETVIQCKYMIDPSIQ